MIERNRIRVVNVARNTVKQLAEDTSEAVYLVVEEHGQAVYVDHVLGDRGVQTHGRLGTRMPLHGLASGKAILAYLPDKRIEEILNRHGLPKQTSNTITARQTLYEKLEKTRERGYAVNEQEANVGTRAVGAPILVDEEVIASIAVAGPANRITRNRLKDEVAGKILAAANEIEIMMQR
ncbi:IclR family transcriptional regulator [Natrinema soli]|uniref:IclR family transcriptional regulator n=2 Tax=Natrinema soli TaxID=1930624 RepID=A0ABD5SH00_9EURY